MLGVPADVTSELMELYFEKHSGTEVADIKRTGDQVLITFASFEGAVSIFMWFFLFSDLLYC